MVSKDVIGHLERCALEAWPAAEQRGRDGWIFRYTEGVTRRANSVLPLIAHGPSSLDERIDAAEAFYAARCASPLFQISALADPPGLEEALAARGYVAEAPVSIRIKDLPVNPSGVGPPATRVHSTPDAAWLRVTVTRGRFAAAGPVFRALLDRIRGPRLFATAILGAEPIAAGLGVLAGSWVGLFSISTLPEHRRSGAARAIVDALCGAARAAGARQAYLQVERDNDPATTLFSSAGFREAYGYHYRRGAARRTTAEPPGR